MITRTDASVVDSKRDTIEPGDASWNAARGAFDLAVDQRPALIAVPSDEAGVVAAVLHARDLGLRVVAQCGGRAAASLGPLDDALLLRTTALAGVEIDVRAHRARVRAGARWADVANPASFLGLAPAAGFARGASVVGTVLGDGMGWLARRHGLAAASVTAVELVTGDGELARAGSDDDAELQRARRRGHRPRDRAPPRGRPLRGRPLLLVRPRRRGAERLARVDRGGAARDHVGRAADAVRRRPRGRGAGPRPLAGDHRGRTPRHGCRGAELIRPLRELRPELDTFTIVPPSALGHLHMEPEDPVARLADDSLVGALPAEAIEAQLALVDAALAPYGAFPARLGGV